MKHKFLLFTVFLLALILRIFLTTSAHHGDLNNNISWGQIAAENGLKGFYGSDDSDDWPYSAPNQPPLTILMFASVFIIWQFIRGVVWYFNWELLIFPSKLVWFWDERGLDILVKLPSILADLGIGWLIYSYLLHKTKDQAPKALVVLIAWLVNPVIWYNSAVWGQTDSVVNFLGLVGVFALLNKRLIKFAVFITLSFLFKGSLGIFAPLLFAITLVQKYPSKVWVGAIFASLVVIVGISVWFHPYIDFPIWLFDLYKTRILPGEIGFLTANAFNFWWLVDSSSVLDSVLYFGFSARVWGVLITLLFTAWVTYWLVNKKITPVRVFGSLAFIAVVSFLFMTRIHERYLYPFFPYATLYLAYNFRFLAIYAVFSIVHLFNLYHLFWIPSYPRLEILYQNKSFTTLLSSINIAGFLGFFRHLRSTKL